MNPYQQVPVGIPVSKNPYPSHPYSQNFPDEPEPEASRLQAPLNNHPQHHYPPQHYYGQQPALMGQPSQFYGAPQGYNQQPQYMMVPIDPERRQFGTKIKDIEEKLNNGWYFVYTVWLWINIVCSALGVFQWACSFLFFLLFLIFEERSYEAAFLKFLGFVTFLILLSWNVWMFQQCLVFKNAMSDKNLKAAQRGFKSMVWYAVYYFVTFVIFLWAGIAFMTEIFPDELRGKSWGSFSVQVFIFMYALPASVHLYGAKKIVELLAERDILVLEFNTRYGTSLA